MGQGWQRRLAQHWTPSQGVKLTGGKDGGPIQFRAVAFGDKGAARDWAQDRDMEALWCSDFDILKQRFAEIGGEIVIERAAAAGEFAIEVVDAREAPERRDSPITTSTSRRRARRSSMSGRNSRRRSLARRDCPKRSSGTGASSRWCYTTSASSRIASSVRRRHIGCIATRPIGRRLSSASISVTASWDGPPRRASHPRYTLASALPKAEKPPEATRLRLALDVRGPRHARPPHAVDAVRDRQHSARRPRLRLAPRQTPQIRRCVKIGPNRNASRPHSVLLES